MRTHHLYIVAATFAVAPVQAEVATLGDRDEMGATEAVDVSDRLLFDFASHDEMDEWTIVNDGVMGGLSESRMSASDEQTAVFEGILSLENNGGFASVRTRPAKLPTQGASAIRVRVKGDGRVYQLRLRTDDRFDGVAYRAEFATEKGEWTTVTIPFSKFEPSFRGYVLPDVPPVDPAAIRQIGFLLGDKKPGPFRLEVDWIAAAM